MTGEAITVCYDPLAMDDITAMHSSPLPLSSIVSIYLYYIYAYTTELGREITAATLALFYLPYKLTVQLINKYSL